MRIAFDARLVTIGRQQKNLSITRVAATIGGLSSLLIPSIQRDTMRPRGLKHYCVLVAVFCSVSWEALPARAQVNLYPDMFPYVVANAPSNMQMVFPQSMYQCE